MGSKLKESHTGIPVYFCLYVCSGSFIDFYPTTKEDL
jgi:hypothetical protein